MSRKGSSGKNWTVCWLLGGCATVFLLYARGGMEAENPAEFWRILCDALFAPGVLLGGIGLLSVVAGEGAFDALHYGVQKLFSLVRKEEKRAALPKTYYDFVVLKHGKKNQAPMALLVTGTVFLVAAGIACLLYYHNVAM